MQQALWQSRQDAQLQGADPTASSSAEGSATQARSIDDEIQYELEMGRGFQKESSSFEQIMSQRKLTPSEVDRLRKVSELININNQRVVELCEAQVRENQAKLAQDTRCNVGKPQTSAAIKAKASSAETCTKGRGLHRYASTTL